MVEENLTYVRKSKNPIINLLKTEWMFLGIRKKIFLFYMFLFFISGILSLIIPLVLGLIFNSIQQTIGTPAFSLRKLIFLFFLMLAIYFSFWMFNFLGRILEQLTGFFVHRDYTNNKIYEILELPIKWHKEHHSGDTIDKVNRSRDSLESFAYHHTSKLIHIFQNIFCSLIILSFVDMKIGIFALVFSSLILLFTMTIDKKLRKCYFQLNKISNKLSACIFDYLSNIFTVITLRLKKAVLKEINSRVIAGYDIEKKEIILNEFKRTFGNIAIRSMTILVLIYKAYTDYNNTGIILIGTLSILWSYLTRVGDSFFEFGEFYGKVVKLNARVEGAYPIDEAFESLDGRARTNPLSSNWKSVEIKNLNFTYDEEGENNHLIDINLKFKKGDKIAFVGESGSGKSTVLAIMRGLYPPTSGEVYCDGEEIANGFLRLSQNVMLIPQEPEIFNNTLRYNITMDLPVKKEEMNKAIEMAQFKKIVERLDKGLETNVLEKGVSLSGGEKQRLALARGLLVAKDSDIVLLDEPTSSVDSLNEMQIHENIFKNFKGKTIISSIHRLHLLNKFDYIYLFDKGKLIAEGTIEGIRSNQKFKYLMRKYGLNKEIK